MAPTPGKNASDRPPTATVEGSTVSAASPSAPTYDAAEWPLFLVTMPPRALSDDEWSAHIRACEEPYRRGQPFYWLIDMADHPPLSAKQRKAVGDAMIAHARRYPRSVCAAAVVVRSAFHRNIATAITWLSRPAYPQRFFEDVPAAREWLGHMGLRAPDAALR